MHSFKFPLLFCLSIAASMTTAPTLAASFDCKKAATKVEKTICVNNDLSKLDDALLVAYKTALAKGDANAIKTAQVTWLKNRNLCEDDKNGMYPSREECIKENYESRLAELNKLIYLPQKLKACTDLAIVNKVTRMGAEAGEAGGEVFVEMEHNVGFYVVYVTGLAKNENVDKYMYNGADFNKGDIMKVCLVEVPKDCPKNDDRGKQYSVTNYKNKKSFVGTPDWHSCGGA